MEHVDFSLVDWSRAQFALTALYHWLFVPLTLGLSFIIAFMETQYVRTGNPEWKRITKFWMTLFGVNFAIGVATGIILEFQFGTNWSNYSWFVGDIFGAPLAIEGIMAFFMESTFIAVMFFGWNKVSKKFHLISTWLVAIGSNLSALWILVANAWMQNPVGMEFNPDTARNEMANFAEVLFNPVAVNKFYHTVLSSYILASVFVVGISAWFLLKNREHLFAKKSIIVASIFGLSASFLTVLTGDGSARNMAKYQPMKFAAMENLYMGQQNAPLTAIGFLQKNALESDPSKQDFVFKIEIPNMLSYMAFLDPNAYVPGIHDLVKGNTERNIMSYSERSEKGKVAITSLSEYKNAKKAGNDSIANDALVKFNENYAHFGYGYYANRDLNELIPSVPTTFYSFRIMVGLGFHFMALFMVVLLLARKDKLEKYRFILYTALWTIPLAYIASELGWVVAEVGRQPWVIQDILPTIAAVSQISSTSVQITFGLFFIIFTGLLIAEIKIMITQIKKGPEGETIETEIKTS
ncbi:MAG: cytochrome ubiquinol oxidase subunit I [Salinivirgaceae bacterium]|jgi:cytochrome d ubiquinol oxidase subunit I|nr:cytochrome ubiquinol oxidase subunit I [Salinivirgaceae bacterium]